jgi:hypothetical protein
MLSIDHLPKAIRDIARLFASKNQDRFLVGKDSCWNTSKFIADRNHSLFGTGLFIQRSVLGKIFLVFSVIFIHTVFSNAQAAPSQAVEYIVDDADSGFSVVGNWLESGSVNEFQGTSKYTRNDNSTAIWETVLEPGTYKVYAWWTAQKSDGSTYDRDERADYIVYHDGGTLEVEVNQTQEAAQWNLLGTVTMTTGTARVELIHDSESNGTTSADAIKWVKDDSGDGSNNDDSGDGSTNDDSGDGSGKAVEYIVDDVDSGFSVVGNWLESGSVNEFQGTSKYTRNDNSTAIWETVLEPGTYKVYAWWTAQKSDGSTYDRDERADYIVYHDGGTLEVEVNQTQEAAQWNLLGTVTMTTGTARVELIHDSESNGTTSADAIKWVKDDSGDGSTNDDSGDGSTNDDSGDGSTNDDSGDGSTNDDSGDGSTNDDSGDGSTNDDSGDGSTNDDSGDGSTNDDSGDGSTNDDSGDGSGKVVEYIVDDADSGFSVVGNWLESGSVNEFQGTSKYTRNDNSTAIWETVLEPGTYKVYAWWTAQKSDGSTYDRDERADYIVYHDGGTLEVEVNQTQEAAQWNFLGTVTITTGTARVELIHDSESNGTTSADAIKWVTATDKKVILSWDPSPVPVLGYYVYYGATPETASQQAATLSVDLGTIDALDPKWLCDLKTDLGVLPGKQVCFRVKAYDGSQLSDYSEAACTIY